MDACHLRFTPACLADKDNYRAKVIENGGGYDALYHTLMLDIASDSGKEKYCDDTPKHLFYLETIRALFPEAKIIGCIRDPRGFLLSYKNYWKVVRGREKDRIKSLYHPIITSMLWRRSAHQLIIEDRAAQDKSFRLIK